MQVSMSRQDLWLLNNIIAAMEPVAKSKSVAISSSCHINVGNGDVHQPPNLCGSHANLPEHIRAALTSICARHQERIDSVVKEMQSDILTFLKSRMPINIE